MKRRIPIANEIVCMAYFHSNSIKMLKNICSIFSQGRNEYYFFDDIFRVQLTGVRKRCTIIVHENRIISNEIITRKK